MNGFISVNPQGQVRHPDTDRGRSKDRNGSALSGIVSPSSNNTGLGWVGTWGGVGAGTVCMQMVLFIPGWTRPPNQPYVRLGVGLGLGSRSPHQAKGIRFVIAFKRLGVAMIFTAAAVSVHFYVPGGSFKKMAGLLRRSVGAANPGAVGREGGRESRRRSLL